MPTYCDACSKPLWDLFNPPAALECLCNLFGKLLFFRYSIGLFAFFIQACHTKIHQEHYTNEKDSFQPCLCELNFVKEVVKIVFSTFLFFNFKVNDENVSARDLLLLCSTPNEQQMWIEKIRKYIPKKSLNNTTLTTGKTTAN